MATALRPLSTGELLDRAFSLYRRHFPLFLGIFALPHLFVFAFQCLALAFQLPGRGAPQTTLVWSLGTILLSAVFSAVSQSATVIAVSQVHLDRPASVMDSFSKVKNQIFGVIALSLTVAFLVGLGCIALIVPGVLLAVRWSLAVPAKVLESKGIGGAMSRSSQLSHGDRGRLFVIWILFLALNLGLGMLLRWPVEVAAGVKSLAALQHVAVGWRVHRESRRSFRDAWSARWRPSHSLSFITTNGCAKKHSTCN
jgi:hypothetical protein